MGLYINHLETVTLNEERSLYVYLLDYGWPDGRWEQIFKRHFMKMADLASAAGAVVVGSPRGIHFANEVLSFHSVGNLRAEDVLPGILITKTHPSYFRESYDGTAPTGRGLHTLLVIPIRDLCKDEEDFVMAIESIFSDLRSGAELKDFRIARNDIQCRRNGRWSERFVEAIELKPGAFGLNLNIKALLFGKN